MVIPEATFQQALDQLRLCGGGRRECVVFLVENIDGTGGLEVVHPDHVSGVGGYAVAPDWLGRFAAYQADAAVAVRAQVHTHPGKAFHSTTDDEWPMVGTTGFLSVVVPNFAREPVKAVELFACRLTATGTWSELDPQALFPG